MEATPLTAGPLVAGFPADGVVATRRAVITGGDDHGDAFGGGLLPESIVEGVAGGTEHLLAAAIGVTEDRGNLIVDGVSGGEIDAAGGIGATGDDEINGCARGDGASPLDVEQRFFRVGLIGDAGIWATEQEIRVVGFEPENLAELLDVGKLDL